MPARRVWSRGNLSDIFQERLEEATSVVWAQTDTRVVNDPGMLINEITEQFGFTPIQFDESTMTRSPIDARLFAKFGSSGFERVPGQVFTARIPFSGSPELLEYDASRPDRERLDSRIRIVDQIAEMDIGSAGDRLTEPMIDEQIQQFKSELTTFVDWANADAARYSEELLNTIRREVLQRKQLLDDTTRLNDALDIPIDEVDIEDQLNIPVTGKLMRLEEYRALRSEAQYRLSGEIYNSVLYLITSFGRAMERLPITAQKFDEEGIRDIVLFVLNANYEGAASGEVFQGAGRTDILLSYQNRTAFIGEFKFWDGPKSVSDAIDQLCRYTVWRDTKASLVVLIKNANATTAIEGADLAIRNHPQFSSALDCPEPDARRDYIITSNTDPDREISLALLYVVIPNPTSKHTSAG
jgi:hypothetical protein